VTAYDVVAWAEFANTVAGGAAGLAGLMCIGAALSGLHQGKCADRAECPGGLTRC
jgi:hypothetical protein